MERRAEIITFAIFLFCSLLPLVSLAPTATSEEGKITIEQRQRHHTTSIRPFQVLEERATSLFTNYNACSPVTQKTMTWLIADSQVKEMVKKIPNCPAVDADCCMHIFYNILQTLKSDIESFCGKNFTHFVTVNTIQLSTTLTERNALHTCKDKNLLHKDHDQIQSLSAAKKKMYIWLVLQKYEQYMQNTTKIYSSLEM